MLGGGQSGIGGVEQLMQLSHHSTELRIVLIGTSEHRNIMGTPRHQRIGHLGNELMVGGHTERHSPGILLHGHRRDMSGRGHGASGDDL